MIRSATLEPPRSGGAALRWPWLLALAVVLMIAAGMVFDRIGDRGGPARLDPARIAAGFGPASFAEAVARAESDVVAARDSFDRAPDEWLRSEVLARALIARWRLLGDYADLAEADRLLDTALAQVPDPAGPALTRALLSGLVHRLDDQQRALDRVGRSVAPDPNEVSDAAALRGDIALQRGELARAEAAFAESERIAGHPGSGIRLAMLDTQRGDLAGAVRGIEALIAKPRQTPAVLASLMLQRANLAYQAGQWSEAGRWIGAAQRVFPGWWLADAYAAQQFALAGRTDEATRAWRIVAERSDRPEVMDALAHLLRLQGEPDESRVWAARAAEKWAAIGARFPEAVAHHRAEHELAVGSAARALALAQADAAARPQAPNLVLLSRALLAAGRARDALAALDRADAQGWVSAGQQMARAEVFAALGDTAGSAAAKARAEEINPRAADARARLIWFGHD